jgi:alanine adding enzyme
MTKYRFCELTDSEFSEYFDGYSRAEWQQSTSAKKWRDLTSESYFLGLKQDNENSTDKVVGAALVVKSGGRFKSLNIPYGPMLDFKNNEQLSVFTLGLKKFAKNHGATYVKCNPNQIRFQKTDKGEIISEDDSVITNLQSVGYNWLGKNVSFDANYVVNSFVKNITFSDEDFKYQTRHKQSLKRAQQAGVKVREIKNDEMDLFIEICKKSADTHGFDNVDLGYCERLKSTFGSKAKFMIAEFDAGSYKKTLGEKLANAKDPFEITSLEMRIQKSTSWSADIIPVAVALFIEMPGEMTYLFSGMDREYRELFAQYSLQDFAIHYCSEHKIPRYNFYGILGVYDGSDGMLDFKRGFNGHVEQLVYIFELPVKKLSYKLMKLMKRIM